MRWSAVSFDPFRRSIRSGSAGLAVAGVVFRVGLLFQAPVAVVPKRSRFEAARFAAGKRSVGRRAREERELEDVDEEGEAVGLYAVDPGEGRSCCGN